MRLPFARIRDNVKVPVRANPSDAGLDVFFCPERQDTVVDIAPGKSARLQTGLVFEIPHGFVPMGCNKSGVAANKDLDLGACVIDSGYEGEVFVDMHNVGLSTQKIRAGDKIAQLVLLPVIHAVPTEESKKTLYLHPRITFSNRGDGALGSTGTR